MHSLARSARAGALAVAISFALVSAAVAAPPPVPLAQREDVREFARELAGESGFDARQVERWLGAAKIEPRIIALMDRPLADPPKWYEYAPPFLAPARVNAGVAYWRAHAADLARAEEVYGVPPEIVVAILGVETSWGRYTGNFRVLDALATLAFEYPRRAPYFRTELKEFLLLARAQRLSPLVPKGSFAGAMGIPQFMPGSYRNYAVDFDGDGHADLWKNDADVIGSVANYLARHEWQRGQPVALRATFAPEEREALLVRVDGGISARRPLPEWYADGVLAEGVPRDFSGDPVGLLLLEESATATAYWIACQNFFVITRYNRSRLYASAVWRLAEAIRAKREAGD